MKATFEITKHALVPVHELLTEKQKEELFKQLNITHISLPKIKKSDPGIQHLNTKPGDIIKIERVSPTAGKAVYYRGITSE